VVAAGVQVEEPEREQGQELAVEQVVEQELAEEEDKARTTLLTNLWLQLLELLELLELELELVLVPGSGVEAMKLVPEQVALKAWPPKHCHQTHPPSSQG
jgi:hypothetical protein